MQRTPPSDLMSYGSDSDLNLNKGRKTFRMKRPHDNDDSSKFVEFEGRLMSMLCDWKTDQNSRLDSIQSSLQEVNRQILDVQKTNAEIERSICSLSENYEEVKLKIEHLELTSQSYEQRIRQLEVQNEELLRKSSLNILEIRNIPIVPEETQGILMNSVIKLFTAVGVNIDSTAIFDIRRISNLGKAGVTPILVTLNSIILKNRIIKAVRTFNSQNKEKINTSFLLLNDKQQVIYVYEHLPPKTRRLHFLGRELVRAGKFKYCWVHNGKVLLRKGEGLKPIYITDESQIHDLKIQD